MNAATSAEKKNIYINQIPTHTQTNRKPPIETQSNDKNDNNKLNRWGQGNILKDKVVEEILFD